jgi:hypothetical protein
MKEWWKDKYGLDIEVGMVRQILKALQDHPNADQWWADKIEQHLLDLGFKPLRQEPCLYLGKYEDLPVLICRQSDDFMFGGKAEPVLRRLCTALGKAVNLLAEPGLAKHYNGLEVVQTRDYVHIHVGPYLDKILDGHGWNMAGKGESRLIEPIHPSAVKELETAVGPECPKAAAKLAADAGFKYRTCIGEIIFAYVTFRPDIGYGVAELSKFSTNPAAVHYSTLKRVYRYLRQTKL